MKGVPPEFDPAIEQQRNKINGVNCFGWTKTESHTYPTHIPRPLILRCRVEDDVATTLRSDHHSAE
eukprot:scaffold13380_cov110-Cylindrotheca_fusiformis.AAC.7